MNVAEEKRSSSLTGIISMEYNAAAAASYANHHHLHRYRVESDWEEKLQALLQNWQWIDYAVVWKLTPFNRPLEWSTGYFNERSLASLPNAQRLSYSVYKSCAFTRSSYRCAVKALSQRFPLWWTSDSPRLPTDEPKDQFLQASGIKTIVCLPGHGSDANMYCLELASTNLIMESSELLHALQNFVSGASYVFPGPQVFASNNYGACNLLGPGGPWSSSYGEPDRSSLRVGREVEGGAAAAAGGGGGGGGGGGSGANAGAGAVVVAAQAVASGSLELVPGALSGNNLVPGGSDSKIFNPAVAGGSSTTAPPHVNSIPACSFEEEISSSSNLVGVADQWFNAHKFGAVPDPFGSSPSVQVSSTMGTSSGDGEMVALVHHHHQQQQQQQQQEVDTVAAGLSSSTSHDGNGAETVSTEMMAHLWASMSDTDVEMPGISSIMSRPAFDALDMAFENDPSQNTTSFAAAAGAGADHHMSEAAAAPPHATSTSSCFDSLAVAAAAAGAYGTHADFAFHHLLQHGSQQSAASADTSCCNCSNSGFDSPLYSLPPESRGAALSCCNASSVVVPGSLSCLPVDASSLHVDKLILAQRAGAPAGDRNPPAAGVTVVDQSASMNPGAPGAGGGHQAAFQENPFHEQQQQQASSTEDSHVSRRILSPFQSLEAAANRHSKHPTFDEVSTTVAAEAVGVITAGSMTSAATHESARQPMIELWKNQLVPRIQQSDSMQRRQLAAEQQPHQPEAGLENHHHSRGSLPRTTVQQQQQRPQQLARSCSTITAETQTSEVPSELINFSPGWHDDQVHIAHNHKLAERDRRQKFKTKILTLRTIIPPTKKNDKLSVLSNTIEYIRQLKDKVTRLQKPPGIISSSLQQNLTNPVQAAAPTVAAPGPSTSCNPIINSNTNTSSVVVSVEVGGGAKADSSTGASPGELIIKVQAPKNPQTQPLIQILTQVRDLELEIGSLSYDLSTNDQVHISLSVLVRSSDSQQQTSWYCNEVQTQLERALQNHENHGHETSTSTNSDTQMEEQQRVRCNSL